jgi:hypothetical protein
MLDIVYTQAWLSLLMFRPESPLFEAAWSEIHALESARTYGRTELRQLRSLAHQWHNAAIIQK